MTPGNPKVEAAILALWALFGIGRYGFQTALRDLPWHAWMALGGGLAVFSAFALLRTQVRLATADDPARPASVRPPDKPPPLKPPHWAQRDPPP